MTRTRIMPRIALVVLCLLGGCSFEADYAGGTYKCTEVDRNCPAGMECRLDLNECRAPRMDAAVDATDGSMTTDGRLTALTCDDPQPFPPTGGETVNTTAGRVTKLMPNCNGSNMFGPDAIYKIEPGAGKQMLVGIEPTVASYGVAAYVTTTCPSTTCLTNKYAFAGNPMSMTTLAGPHYVVVDSPFSAQTGQYRLTITITQ
jgi:hypothetical protein